MLETVMQTGMTGVVLDVEEEDELVVWACVSQAGAWMAVLVVAELRRSEEVALSVSEQEQEVLWLRSERTCAQAACLRISLLKA